MSNDAPHTAVSASLAAVEPNVVIAGVEAAVVGWVLQRTASAQPLAPAFADNWHWSFVVYGLVALLGIVVAGLALEGLAGLTETLLTRRWWGQSRGVPWEWYWKLTRMPTSWGQAQRWIWKSAEAYHEFSRRRLRILVSRNTAFALLVLSVGLMLLDNLALALGALAATVLFGWLWLDAHKGWNIAVTDAGQIGPP